MKYRLENIGIINKADFELGKLTVICGKNNMGKTYTAYALYGFLKQWMDLVNFDIDNQIITTLLNIGSVTIDLEDYRSKLDSVLKKATSKYSKNIYEEYNANKEEFEGAIFDIMDIDKSANYADEFRTTLASEKNEILGAFKEADSSKISITYYISDKKNKVPVFIVERFLNNVLGNILLQKCFLRPFIITAERTGIHLFQKELDINKNVLLEAILKQEKEKNKHINPFHILDETTSRYFRAIKDNIDFARDKDNYHKQNSFLSGKKTITKYVEKNLLGVDYKLTDGNQLIKLKDKVLPFYMASSSVRALADLSSYIKNIAKKNDLLIIDEPELNLHPENQIKLARLFVKLINNGVNVLITTHSDYIIKELNNLIMLSNDFAGKAALMKKYNYETDDILAPNDIKPYFANNGTLEAIGVDKLGMLKSSFDDAIININKISNELVESLEGEE